jgi:hyperosmotically inducible periplasmic protein
MRASRIEWIGLLLAVVLAGCSGGQRNSAAETRNDAPATQARTNDPATPDLPTPFDQGSSETDVRITTAIRQALVAEEGLSIDAANAKVITNGGVVVLRGAVRDANEKNFVRSVAESTPGAIRVVDLLEYTNTH